MLVASVVLQGCQSTESSGISASTPNDASGVEKPEASVTVPTVSEGEACHTSPSRDRFAAASGDTAMRNVSSSQSGSTKGMVLIKGGEFQMGTDDGMPYEAPRHRVAVEPFYMDTTEATVGEFAGFVEATNYKTEAEQYGWSGVFDVMSGEWTKVDGANWCYPEGPGRKANLNEPVVQTSWADATAYAKWSGKRLPTEAEWEYAARAGLIGEEYSWSDELRPGGKPVANWWQGTFPNNNTGEDGFVLRAPVASFNPNGYGLHDMAGNAWEWCSDWYEDDAYAKAAHKHSEEQSGWSGERHGARDARRIFPVRRKLLHELSRSRQKPRDTGQRIEQPGFSLRA